MMCRAGCLGRRDIGMIVDAGYPRLLLTPVLSHTYTCHGQIRGQTTCFAPKKGQDEGSSDLGATEAVNVEIESKVHQLEIV